MTRATQISLGLAVVLWSAVASAGTVVWNLVTDYGMTAANATPAVAAAVADAVDYLSQIPADEVVLYFPAGEWTIHHPDSHGIYIQNLESGGRLILRGESRDTTTIVFDQFDQYGICLRHADHITIEQIHFTRPQNYTAQGDVVSVSPALVRFKLHDGFMDPVWLANAPLAQSHHRNLLAFDGSDLMEPVISTHANKIVFDSITDAGNGEYDVHINLAYWQDRIYNLAVGDQVAVKCKVGGAMIWGMYSDHVLVQDIRITNGAGSGVWLRQGDHQIARRVQIDRGEPINGKLPFFAQPGDGLHFWPGEDNGDILVEDNVLIGTADDAIAVLYTATDPSIVMSNVVVRGNTVRSGQRRGIIHNQSINSIISNNTVLVQSGDAIHLRSTENTLVQGNTIVDNRAGMGVCILKEGESPRPQGNRVLENLFVKANTNTHLIGMSGANNTVIDGNRVVSFSDMPGYDYDNLINPAPIIYGVDCTNVSGTNILFDTTDAQMVGSDESSGVNPIWEESSGLRRPSDDVYVWLKNPTSNYGQSPVMTVHENGAGDNTRDALMKFSVAGYTSVGSAKIVLPIKAMGVVVGLEHSLIATETGWNEATVTWNNAPADIGNFIGTWVPQCYGAGAIDVTDLVNDALANGASEISVRIASTDLGTIDYTTYGTKENSDPLLHPAILFADGEYTVEPVADSYVRGGTYAQSNYGDSKILRIKEQGVDNSSTQESLLKFSIENVPSVSQAILRVFAASGSDSSVHSLYRVLNTWQENTVTYANKPSPIGGEIANWQTITGQFYDIDVTDVVESQVESSATSVSFSIVADAAVYSAYASRENATAARHPTLTIIP